MEKDLRKETDKEHGEHHVRGTKNAQAHLRYHQNTGGEG
jgi:ribosomal protein L29